MAALETIQPYVEQLFDDSDVQKQLSRAAANLRGARARVSDSKSKKKVLQDRRLRRRLLEGGRAVVAAGVAIKQGPEKQARRGRRRWLLVVAAVGVAGFLATNDEARSRLTGLIGAADNAPADPASP
jgi:hypothetical protein